MFTKKARSIWQEVEKRDIEILKEINKELLLAAKEALKYFKCSGENKYKDPCGTTFTCYMCQGFKNLSSIITDMERKKYEYR